MWPYAQGQSFEATWSTITSIPVTSKIRSGSNTISIYAEDYGGGSGVLARLTMTGVPGFVIDNTAPSVSEVQRQLVAETSSTWNAPRYTVTATDSVGIATVMLQTASSSNGPWTDSGTAVTQPFSGSIYVVPGPTISGTKWVRMSVKDAAGNESITGSVLVTVWNASSGNAEWTTGGSAYFSGGWLVLTPSSNGQKGGGYFEPLVPTGGQVSVSFDLEVNGSADGMCVPFFSSASAFLTGDAGGSLGCQGMAGTFFVGIEEYGTDTVRIGTPTNGLYSETTVYGLANTSNDIRITIILTPSGSSTLIDVRAQVGSANPVQMASRTMSGTLPSAGTLVGFTAGTGGETAEHKIRNIVISGLN